MYKLASIALSGVIGVAGIAHSPRALAQPYVSIGIGLPAVAVLAPYPIAPAYTAPYYAPYYRAYGPYWHRDHYHGYDRFHGLRYAGRDHGWDHEWDHGRDHGRDRR